jgi:uncharacterized protein (DUF2252 family)
MNIHKATQSYENWMRSCTAVIEAQLRLKHKQMRESPFLFFRGTFYRWAQLWPDVCASLRDAPKVLAVGDLHVAVLGLGATRRVGCPGVSMISMNRILCPIQMIWCA